VTVAKVPFPRGIAFPCKSTQLVARSRASVFGTVAAAHAALEDGIACNLAGGTHHAFAAEVTGFCVFNDIAVAARALQREGLIGRAVIVDLDVHQGDGKRATSRAIRRCSPSPCTARRTFPSAAEELFGCRAPPTAAATANTSPASKSTCRACSRKPMRSCSFSRPASIRWKAIGWGGSSSRSMDCGDAIGWRCVLPGR